MTLPKICYESSIITLNINLKALLLSSYWVFIVTR